MKTLQKNAKTHTCTKVLNNSATLCTIVVTVATMTAVVVIVLVVELVIFV